MAEKNKNKALQLIKSSIKSVTDFTANEIEELRAIFEERFPDGKNTKHAPDTIERIFINIDLDHEFGTEKAAELVGRIVERFPECQNDKSSTHVVKMIKEVEKITKGGQGSVFDLKKMFLEYEKTTVAENAS